MSILQYCVRLRNSKMPKPRGSLFRAAMPSLAIAAANKEISQLTAKSSKRGRAATAKEDNHTALLD